MPILDRVNVHRGPDGTEYPINIYYTIDEPAVVTQDTPTMVFVAGLGAQCITTPYNTLVKPFVDKGYRVVRFDNRDCGLSTRLDEIAPLGMIFSKLKNRLNDQNSANCLMYPLPKSHTLPQTDHKIPHDITQADFNEECYQPGMRPSIFMQEEKHLTEFSAPYPKPAGGFWSSIGLGKSTPAYDLYDMALDAVLLCDRLGIKNAHFSGCSMGGMIVTCIAAIKPSLVQSLCLIMTTTGNTKFNAAFKFVFSTFVTRTPPKDDAPIEDWINFGIQTQAIIGTPDSETKRFNNGQTAYEFVSQIATRTPRSPSAMVRQIDAIDSQEARCTIIDWLAPKIPVCVFHGDNDQLVPTANAPHFHTILKNSLHRVVNPPSSFKPKSKDDLSPKPDIQELEVITQNFDDLLDVTTVVGNVLPNGVQNFTTLAILKGQAHEMNDDFCKYLAPSMLAHMESAMGKMDVTLPRELPSVTFGTNPDLLFNAPRPEPKEVEVEVNAAVVTDKNAPTHVESSQAKVEAPVDNNNVSSASIVAESP